MGAVKAATKIALGFKGAVQVAWVGEDGEILREKGVLGLRLEKTDRRDALGKLATASSEDLTRLASVPSNRVLKDPSRIRRLRVIIDGIGFRGLQLTGGRQKFEGKLLSVEKEFLQDLPPEIGRLGSLEKIFLRAGPFIQSDHPRIKTLAREITGSDGVPLAKIRRLVDWVHDHIEKRPVLSLPDALSTLKHRVGDCNEHAVLLAALARAAGLPCRVEAGLVYLNGRFYYHAWNLVYVGRWITADALFGQVPADATHIRFITGSPDRQLDLMGVMGRVRLQIIEAAYE